MANPTYTTGTVSVADGDLIIVGSGTIWSGVNVKAGDTIYIGTQDGVEIKDVTDTTHLTLWSAWAGGAQAAVTYTIVQNYPARVVGVAAAEDVGVMIAKLRTGGLPFLVEAPETVPDPSLGADGQYAIEPISGEQWLKTGGLWVSQGIFKAFGAVLPWSGVTTYQVNDLVSLSGTTYACILAHTNQTPPNATYWTVFAAKGDTGDAAWTAPAAWLTATAYVAGPPANVVTEAGETFVCLVDHTSGTFATDLAAAKWIKVAEAGTNGTDGAGYGGTSTTSLLIAAASKVFTTQAGLAYTDGSRVRSASAANTANYMEGRATYSGTTLTIDVDRVGGSGTFSDWNLNIAGDPGAGDLSSVANLSDLADAATSLNNLSGVSYGAVQSLSDAQKAQAKSNVFKGPTTQVFTTGSGTYTTPANVLWIEIELIGGGGGGAGSGTGPGNGGAAGNTTFSTFTGGGANGATANAGGVGGTPSGGFVNKTGATGGNGSGLNATAGGFGANSPYGGAGVGGAAGAGAGVAAAANTGSGGGGGGVNTTVNGGGGGGAGGFVRAIINSPAATYSYGVAAGGTGGAAGTSGAAGGAGGSGFIQVTEHYG